jgi:VCBS repeat-containing protein
VTITVSAVNDPPVAVDDAYTIDEDTSLNLAAPGVLANDSDVDGDTLTLVLVTAPQHGSGSIGSDGSFSYTPDANFHGSDNFIYKASDGTAESNIATVTITVIAVNDPPVANDDSATTDEDMPVTIDVLANDTDVDGDILSVISVATPTNGYIMVEPDSTITYSPDADYEGPDWFTYTVSDGNGGADSANVTITVSAVNDPPVAVDDAYAIDEDTSLNLAAPGVLGNDIDVDGDTLTLVVVTVPQHGSGSIGSDGSFNYTPDANFHGSDNFTYRASDGTAESNIATVTITIGAVNDPPVANDDSATTDEDTPVTIDVLANDTDEDGDTLVVDSVTQGSHGSVTNNGIDVTYSPNADYEGPDDWFIYTISDGNGGSDSANVTISISAVNDPPVADANGPYISYEGTAVNFDASGSSDVDGDTLQYRWDFEDDGTWDTTWTSDPSAVNTWHDDWSGTARVEVFDGLLSDNATATVTIYNVPPTVSAGPDQVINSGDNVTINVPFTDPGTMDTHTAIIDWGDGNDEPGTVLEVNGSGNVTGSHQYLNLGSYTITITVTDDDGGAGSDSFQVEVRRIDAEIDIKPGSDTNPINIDSKGRTPVAILTNEGLDATDVDVSTVRFGPGQAIPVHYAIEDIDGDGDDDMILHFNTQELGLTEDDVKATLSGETTEGAYFTGTDSVKIIKSKNKEKEQNGKAKGKEDAPGQNKEPGEPANGKGGGKEKAPGQNKEPGPSANTIVATGNENAPGQNKEPGPGANSIATGKENAPGQNKEPANSANGKGKGKGNN